MNRARRIDSGKCAICARGLNITQERQEISRIGDVQILHELLGRNRDGVRKIRKLGIDPGASESRVGLIADFLATLYGKRRERDRFFTIDIGVFNALGVDQCGAGEKTTGN